MGRLSRFTLVVLLLWPIAGCGGGSTPSESTTTPQPSVTLNPPASNVRPGDPPLQFTATVAGTSNTAVTWSVNGTVGGSAATGLINTSGQYTAPASVPTNNVMSVQAALVSAPTVQGTSLVTLLNPIPVVTSVSPQIIGVGAFTIQVNGSGFVSGAQVMFGTTALTTAFASSTQLNATGTATASQAGSVAVTVVNPAPGVNNSTTSAITQVTTVTVETVSAAVRFLEQSTLGPTPALIAQVQQMGFPEFLTSQFATSGSTYPDPASTVTSLLPTQQVFFTNALNNSDQLRQRVALALSEIWVASGFTVPPQGMAPYMRLLLQDAFVNYRTLMNDVSLSPAMGLYLNMVNNDNPPAGQHANENYARELMQLFTLGLDQLNEDGTMQQDSSGNPIPTYTQANVEAFALAYTGWTYPTQAGATLQKHNPAYWIGPMVPFESNHNVAAKVLLPVNGAAVTLPAGQSAENDLSGALDNIFAQPELPPFVCKQLIQHLVSSNPSSAYVKRVADVFVSGSFSGGGITIGSGQRGDMQAVIAAILLDSEARRGDSTATANPSDGHLREPILYIANLLRAFGATSDGAAPANAGTSMSESVMDSPSVFNFFPPDYNIPGTNLLGPEFDLETTATTLVRANFVNSFVYGSIGTGTTVNFTTYANLSANPNAPGQLLDSLNALLLHNAMTSDARASIVAAVNTVPAGSTQNLLRAEAAIYLILSSSQYQVEQ
ncbi:MAG: DUF1800 family protein [Candidatus Acidiferrales bacterium]